MLNGQAEKDLLAKDTGDLSPTELNGLIGDSSAFTSDDYGKYVDKMREMISKKHKVLSDREQKLMSGVFLKEQEIKNLLNLGLGGLLRELRSMTERNMIFEKRNSTINLGKI